MASATGQMAFNAAKAGVEQLSRDLGVHFARSGIRVNALSLGPIETPQLAASFNQAGSHELARRLSHMPMGRFGTIEELAATVAFLASDDAGFVTAAAIPINGGIPSAFTTPPAQQRRTSSSRPAPELAIGSDTQCGFDFEHRPLRSYAAKTELPSDVHVLRGWRCDEWRSRQGGRGNGRKQRHR